MENSQVQGSCVIVYSMGNCPMRMIFRKLSARDGAYQEKSTYEFCPTFCFRFGKGWVCILDVIDDLLMLHGMDFVGLKEEGVNEDECVRVAMVIRLLSTVGEFYTDTSTMRLTGESLRFAGKSGTEESDVCRNVYS